MKKLLFAAVACLITYAAYAITVPFTITVGTVQVPGPSLALYNAQTYYTCTNNRFVSTSGSGSNNGLTSGAPWDVATAIAYAAPAGTCINLATGLYTTGGLTITHGGTSASLTGYVVWRCSSMPFSFSSGVLQGEGTGCRIQGTSSTNPITISGAPYLMFDALEIFTNVLPSNNCIGDEGGGNGTDNTGSHHIWVLNSDWHGCGQSGLQWNNTDWLFAIHNVFHDNSSNASFGVFGSGISFYDPVGKTGYSPTTEDNKWCSATNSLCYHMVIAYNVGYHNFNIQSGTGNSDGEGIILDDFQHGQNACPGTGTCPYTGNVLVMGNIMYNNGGSGIENNSKFSGTTTLVNNTMYSNNWDTHNTGTFRGGIYSQDDLNTVSINNVSYAVLGAGILASNSPYLGQCNNAPPCAGLVWQTNLSFPGGDNNFDNTFNVYSTTGTNKNLDGSDPKFVNASTSTPNFALQGTSPAIGFGQAFDLFRASGPVDAGACPSSLTICP